MLYCMLIIKAGSVAQLVGHLTHKSGVLGSIPSLATYFRFSFHFFKKGSCQLLAKVRGWIKKYVNFRYSNFVFTDNEIKYT